MIAFLAKLMDWSAIQAVSVMMPSDSMQHPRLEEALEFLKGPEFIPNESQPARVEFDPEESGMHFRFPSPRPGNFAENNIVYGQLYRCGERWRERPVVILLHGSGDSLNYKFRFPLIARRCHRAGFNAASLVAPYHFQRRPRQLGGSLGYSDCLQFAEATAQAIAEIRALTGWLLGKVAPQLRCGAIRWEHGMREWQCAAMRGWPLSFWAHRARDKSLGGSKGHQTSCPGKIAGGARAMRGVESDGDEFDYNKAADPRKKYIIARNVS